MCTPVLYTVLSGYAFPDSSRAWLLYTQIINIHVFNMEEHPNTESWDCCIILIWKVEDTRNVQQKWNELF
jgi:hypothetical protein